MVGIWGREKGFTLPSPAREFSYSGAAAAKPRTSGAEELESSMVIQWLFSDFYLCLPGCAS